MHIWAEAGACEGDLEYAKQAAREVHGAGAHALKVQWLSPHAIFSKDAVRYDHTPGEWTLQADGYPKVLSYHEWAEVAELCSTLGIGFIPALFDTMAVQAATEMGLAMVKVASGDLTNEQLIRSVAESGIPNVTLSTGAATMDEVTRAVDWVHEESPPASITLLACHLEYPTPLDHAHLGRIIALREKFPNLNVGYSDHTPGLDTVPLAVCLGAQVLEKHFTSNRALTYGDHSFAVDKDELAEMVQLSQLTLGVVDNIELVPTPGEMAALVGARRSLYATRDIKSGSTLKSRDLIPLRPYSPEAIDATEFTATVGQRAFTDLKAGEAIRKASVGLVGATLSVD